MKRVSYIFPTSHHYRLPFHEQLRERLARHAVDYKVVYCDPAQENIEKRDTVEVPFGVKVTRNDIAGLVYQHGLREAWESDLVIMQQESKLALNYLLHLVSMCGVRKIAFFGHGRNFQSRNPSGKAERFKRFWATKVDWWFGYTDETRRHVESLGFPPERITVFNNAVDTSQMRRMVEAARPERLAELRTELRLTGEHVGVFVGGIYPDKRMEFLADAADRVRQRLSNFELLVIGGGNDLPLVERLAASRPWMRVLGPRFGQEKVDLMRLGKLFLMPGLVGLAVIDAATAGLPTVTTAFPWHSPEIAYIDNGVNGVIVPEWEDPAAYADVVAGLLADSERLAMMRAAAERMAQELTIEAMADRFAEGVLRALAA